MLKTLNISVTPKSQTIPDADYEELFDLSSYAHGIMIYPTTEDVIVPWDSDIEVKSGRLVLRGSAAPGDPRSSCDVRLDLSRVNNYIKMTIEPKDDDSETRIREILEESNWVVS